MRFVPLVLALTLAACGGSNDDSISGVWVGRTPMSADVQLTLLERDGEVTGHLGAKDAGPGGDADVVTFTGFRTGNDLSLVVTQEGEQSQLVGRIDADSIVIGGLGSGFVFVRQPR